MKELKLHRRRREAFFSSTLAANVGRLRQNNTMTGTTYALVNGWGMVLYFIVVGLLIFILPDFDSRIDRDELTGYAIAVLFMRTYVIALMVLIASFLVYAFALGDPHLPPQELPKLWAFPVDHYIAASGAPTGWNWVTLLHRGDYLNFIGVALFAGISAIAYARIVPLFLARGEHGRATIAVLQILVLVAAASGVVLLG